MVTALLAKWTPPQPVSLHFSVIALLKSQKEGQARPKEQIMRQGCRAWRGPWADPAPFCVVTAAL